MIALAALQLPSLMADLPFEHAPGRIWLKGTLNGKPVRTALDSGAGGIVVSERAAEAAGGTKGAAFRSNTEGDVSDGWWASGLTFGLVGAPMTVSATAIASFAKTAGGGDLDVAAGYPLFSVFGIGIDYVHSRVRIYAPSAFVPPPGAVALPLTFRNGTPRVAISLQMPGGKRRKVVAMVDTGSPLGIEVTRRLAKLDGMDKRYESLPVVDLPGGVGGPTRGRTVSGMKGDLGGSRIDGEAVVNLTPTGGTGDAADYDILLGDGVLRHFDLTFDYLRATLWIRPNGK